MKIRLLLINFIIILILAGCNYVPEGSTAFKIEGKTEYDRGDLKYFEGTTQVGSSIKLKWYDTNTFITDQELRPGTYELAARNMQGKGTYKTRFEIVPDKQFYELTKNPSEINLKSNHKLTGQIKNMQAVKGTIPLHIVFVGKSFDTRTVQVGSDGKFSTEVPQNENYKISLFISGDRPMSYSHPASVNLESNNANLGTVALTY